MTNPMLQLDDLINLVRLQLGVRAVDADAELQADLGAESIDIQNLVSAAEQRYEVTFDDDDLERLVTVRDLYDLLETQVANG